jgi:3-dehydroquinate synthase
LEGLGLLHDHPSLRATDALFAGLEEFRQHLGGRLTVTMLQQIGRPIDVHEVDRERMTEAIRRVQTRVAARGLTIPAARA